MATADKDPRRVHVSFNFGAGLGEYRAGPLDPATAQIRWQRHGAAGARLSLFFFFFFSGCFCVLDAASGGEKKEKKRPQAGASCRDAYICSQRLESGVMRPRNSM